MCFTMIAVEHATKATPTAAGMLHSLSSKSQIRYAQVQICTRGCTWTAILDSKSESF